MAIFLEGSSTELPRWKCHKEVRALKIERISDPAEPGSESDGSRILHGQDAFITVGADYMRRHQPIAPGYYVVYEDGYVSWSPVKAFEDGYTLLTQEVCQRERLA